MHVDIEPTQIGRVFPPDYSIVSDAGAALALLVEVAKERQAAGRLRDYALLGRGVRQAQGHHVAPHPLRQRAGQAAAGLRGDEPRVRSGYPLRVDDRAVADRRRPVPARLPAPALDQRRAGRPAGLDAAGRARGLRGRPGRPGGRPERGLRLPVHARGAGRRGPVQPALHPCPGEQLLPGSDPPVAARVRDGLLRAAGLREHQQPGPGRVRRRPRQGGRGHWAARRCGWNGPTTWPVRSRRPRS